MSLVEKLEGIPSLEFIRAHVNVPEVGQRACCLFNLLLGNLSDETDIPFFQVCNWRPLSNTDQRLQPFKEFCNTVFLRSPENIAIRTG